MKIRSKLVMLLLLLLSVNFLPYTMELTHAQIAQISGIITDATGAAIAGAHIDLTNNLDGTVQSTTSDEAGKYQFFNVKVGGYTITAKAGGFNSSVTTINLTPTSLIVNIELTAGGANAVVDVTDMDRIKLQTTDQQLSTTIDSRKIVELPANNRNSLNLSILSPGVVSPNSQSRNGNFQIDGADNSDASTIHNANPEMNTEAYDRIYENSFLASMENPLSTFSIDVDTASYSNMRRFLNSNQMPPKDAVRIEELINYFPYNYTPPDNGKPFTTRVEIAECPWNKEHRLVRIGLKGREIQLNQRPHSNLVFLLDVSGSMDDENKLPLVQKAMRLLVEQLNEHDRISIVVYAGASGLVLPVTNGNEKAKIINAIDNLSAGGSTNGAAGIELAYKVATENFIKDGVNRVILATDGDFNVGVTNQGELTRLIEEKAKSGVFLSVLGFGMGNYKDSTMEQLADKGNGNYAYIDNFNEARKVFVEQMSGTLITIAKDVKIQIEFNPNQVRAYRLIGYENRMLAAKDFDDDKKDAGEIGAGHTVTALYEVVPANANFKVQLLEPLKYQQPAKLTAAANSKELLTLKLRYKAPDGNQSQLLSFPIVDKGLSIEHTSDDFRFAASVAAFGMLLRGSENKGNITYQDVKTLAEQAVGDDRSGYRKEFITLVEKAAMLDKQELSHNSKEEE